MLQKIIPILFLAVFSLSACVAKKELILPTSYDRETRMATYKQCVSQATSRNYDARRNPDEIVQASLQSCRNSKNWMLQEYPASWRPSMAKKVEEQVYKDEIAWILRKR